MYNQGYSNSRNYYDEMNETSYEEQPSKNSRHRDKYEKRNETSRNRERNYEEYEESKYRDKDRNKNRERDYNQDRNQRDNDRNYRNNNRDYDRSNRYQDNNKYERDRNRYDKNDKRGYDKYEKESYKKYEKNSYDKYDKGTYNKYEKGGYNKFERDNHYERDDRSSKRNKDFRDSRRAQAAKEREIVRSKSFKNVYKFEFAHRPTLFDLAPPGYEETTVEEYKRLKAMGSLPVSAIPHGSSIILRARRLYVENIPEGCNQDDLIEHINQECVSRNISTRSGYPSALVFDMGHDGTSAYLEFRTAEECTNAIQLDGLEYMDQKLQITRPNDFQASGGYYHGCPTVFQDTLNKLFVACVPIYLSDDQVRELLTAFGELKAFNLVKDGASGLSKGYAFCEYRDGTVTDIAISGLNGMQIADKKLVVQRAVLGSRAGTNLGGIIPSFMQVPGIDPDHIISHDLLVTEVLCLINCLTANDLADDNEYEEIIEEVRTECEKFGEVVTVVIPRPDPENPDARTDNLGKIFIQYKDKDHCKEAHETLAGRKFKDRLVITTFYDLEKFLNGDY